MLPSEIPLFPLPNVVLFPGTRLPLHIFEPRYRAMVADALAGERLIGIVLRPGWEADYEGHPAVYAIGCAGFMTHAERLADGRYNILLRGLEKFRITSERPECEPDQQHPYRIARIETIPETLLAADRMAIHEQRQRLEELIARRLKRPTHEVVPRDIGDEDLVNALAQYLSLDPLEKQALLECNGLLARSRSLVELIEMKMLATSEGGKIRVH